MYDNNDDDDEYTTKSNNIEQLLMEFMESKLKNCWLDDGYILVYVRKGHHLIDGHVCSTFDIANVKIEKEHQGKGYFKKFIELVEGIGLLVYVETILNPNLIEMLRKHGYEIIDNHGSINAIKRPVISINQ